MMHNLHTHTRYSDGSDSPDVYVKFALEQGFRAIGFSDHSPLPFDNTFALREEQTVTYCEEILDLKRKFDGRIDIFLGMEVDFIPGTGHSPAWFRKHYPLDYIIGSVHLVKNPDVAELWFIDGPRVESYDKGLAQVFSGDIRKAVNTYFDQLSNMIVNYKPDVIGHLDKIKMHNKGRYFQEDEPWYQARVDETLALAKEAGCVIEVNTRGIYKKRSKSHFPGKDILQKIKELKVPLTISSDAHKPHEISSYFRSTYKLLASLGFREQWILTKDGWKSTPLPGKN